MTQTKYTQRAGNTWRKYELIPLNPYGQESHRPSVTLPPFDTVAPGKINNRGRL
jgi:hypothetical protein